MLAPKLPPRSDPGALDVLVRESPQRELRRLTKRAMDMVIASLMFFGALPVMLGAAVAIAVADRQWPLYLDERVGLGGKHFPCWKLRTMRNRPGLVEAYLAAHPEEQEEWIACRKLRDDPRKTPLGSFLRKTSLDELPQLVNVLRGEMSIVGPRPISPAEFAGRGPERFVLATVRPGITGLWQVKGRSTLDPRERLMLDSYYARQWSLAMDIRILLATPAAVLTARGAR
ncbi:MAG: sugar transferase [Chloroflexi bacterium]|nr:sugar transferase [Chloroflexota bacterium]